MLDMVLRCGGKNKATFVFFDTGLEYEATKRHIGFLEEKYGITIDRVKAVKPLPMACKEFGLPFISKYVADRFCRLQEHGFQFEDAPLDVLLEEYPGCKSALEWWCNSPGKGETTQYRILRYPYLKEFVLQNAPPRFSAKCCDYTKKKTRDAYMRGKGFDLQCVGIRKAEGGIRASSYKSCFTGADGKVDQFRPLFWFRNCDKEEYCSHYGIVHSKCYTEYGLKRTGCAGCPFALDFERELEVMKECEPKLYKAANAIFGSSYEYTRKYREFRAKEKNKREITSTEEEVK